jgi:hypothetical protein
MQQNIPCRPIFFRIYSDYVVERAIQGRILSSMDAPLLGTGFGESMQNNGHLGLSRANFNRYPRQSKTSLLKPCLSAPRQLPPPTKSVCPVTKFKYEVHTFAISIFYL